VSAFLERDGIRHPRSVLVSNLRGAAVGTPLEIQFRESVRMFFK
jgi:hypothetical protein